MSASIAAVGTTRIAGAGTSPAPQCDGPSCARGRGAMRVDPPILRQDQGRFEMAGSIATRHHPSAAPSTFRRVDGGRFNRTLRLPRAEFSWFFGVGYCHAVGSAEPARIHLRQRAETNVQLPRDLFRRRRLLGSSCQACTELPHLPLQHVERPPSGLHCSAYPVACNRSLAVAWASSQPSPAPASGESRSRSRPASRNHRSRVGRCPDPWNQTGSVHTQPAFESVCPMRTFRHLQLSTIAADGDQRQGRPRYNRPPTGGPFRPYRRFGGELRARKGRGVQLPAGGQAVAY